MEITCDDKITISLQTEQTEQQYKRKYSQDLLNIIKSQTNYTDELLIIEKLDLFNGDYIKVIKEYLQIPDKIEPKVVSINQQIYKSLRKQTEIKDIDGIFYKK
jgi:predicted RNA-binding protein with RPS1 domain